MSQITSRYLAGVAAWEVGLFLCERALKDLKVSVEAEWETWVGF